MSTIVKLRSRFQRRVCSDCIYFKATDASRKIPSIADIGSPLSVELSKALVSRLGHKVSTSKISGQTAGKNFEDAARGFVQAAIAQLAHLRPAEFAYRVHGEISSFVQYQHLAELQAIIEENRQARTALGSYLIKPDVIISRKPIDDAEINHAGIIVSPAGFP